MIVQLIVKTTIWLVVMAAILFGAAGTPAWTAGWVFLVQMAVWGFGLGFYLAWRDPGLLAERLGSPVQRAQKGWDKIFMSAFMVLWLVWFAAMPLDAVRFHWSVMPLWGQVLGFVLISVSIVAILRVFQENSFAAPVVKLQPGQPTISTGPYAIVRHPMYAGALLYLIGVPLLLGSWLGLAALVLLVPILAMRAVLEERTLIAELPGYAEYAARVRYRLVPGIW